MVEEGEGSGTDMAKHTTVLECKEMSYIVERLPSVFGSVFLLLFMALALWGFTTTTNLISVPPPVLVAKPLFNIGASGSSDCKSNEHDSSEVTFYDDPNLDYSVETRISDWDGKRHQWLQQHHHQKFAGGEGVLLLTGSQPFNCYNPTGDYTLLRFFKNKVDYCRIHDYDIFYNNANLHPKMDSYWAKISIIKAAMLAHPETEWIWWVDSDAVFTDMEFKLPLDRYKNHNLVVDGWPEMIYKGRSWIGLNAGVLLFRNCQWSMDFMDSWASLGPQTPNYEKWGQRVKEALSDKPNGVLDDQSALVYLLLKQEKWADKVYIENDYCFQCYWAAVVGELDNVTEKYTGLEKKANELRRRHAEVDSEGLGALRDKYLNEAGYEKGTGRRPFITHFTGCQPCSGNHNPMYQGNSCKDGLERALNFADNQVLRNYGFGRSDLLNSKSLSLVPFDSPGM